MQPIFSTLDTLLDLPYPAFEKKLAKVEEEFRDMSITDVTEEELDTYYQRLKHEYQTMEKDAARIRLDLIGYISHFDMLVEKYFPDYVLVFQESFERADRADILGSLTTFLEHLDEILRDYTHRLSDPDNYPSYTGFIQELIQTTMIDLFFWLQDRESEREKKAATEDRNTDIYVKNSLETKDSELQFIRKCLELLGEGVLEKIFYDHEYPMRVSATDSELQLIGRYKRKTS